MAQWTKIGSQADTKFVGYFPTPQFWSIIKLWDDEQVEKYIQILSLRCWRAKMAQKNVLTPLPYVDITEIGERTIVVDYNFIKHGKLHIGLLCDTISKYGAKDMVVESICACIPKDLLEDANSELEAEAKMWSWKTGDKVAAFFRRTKAVANGEFRAEVRKATKDWLPMGGKLSSLDLVGLREAHYWHRKGDYGSYEINFMERTVRLVMTALDPDGVLGRWREYKRKKGQVWSLVGDHSIKE